MSTPTSSLPPVLFPLPSGPLSEVIAEVLRPGLQQLQNETPEGYALLASWAEPILERMAWKALTNGLGADGDVGSAEPFVEAELKRQSKPGASGGSAGRRQLMALLAQVDQLLLQVGWLERKRHSPVSRESWLEFSSPWLPSILVGKRLGSEPNQAADYRSALGAAPSWALAGWAAVRQGDSAEPWIDLFLEERDPVQWFLRIVPTACVLAAVQPGAVPEAKFLAAYQGCVQGLCWFPPQYAEGDGSISGSEPATGWQLPHEPWRQAVMALASLPSALQSWTATLPAGFWNRPPQLLVPLLSMLGLDTPDGRPKAPTPKDIAGLLLPQRALAEDLWDLEFWQHMAKNPMEPGLAHVLEEPTHSGYSGSVKWQEEVCLPALLKASTSSIRAIRLLALPVEEGPWGLLLVHPNLVHYWVEVFHTLLEPGVMDSAAEPKEICDAWARVMSMAAKNAQYRYGAAADAVDAQLQQPIGWLKAHRLWPLAQESLRRTLVLQPPRYDRERNPVGFAAALKLFQLAALTEEDWTQFLAKASLSLLRYDSLYQEAGAPQKLMISRVLDALQSELQQGRQDGRPSSIAQQVRNLLGDVTQPKEAVEAILRAMTEPPNDRLAMAVAKWPDGPWLQRLLDLQGSALHDKVQPWLIHLAKFAQDVGVRRLAALALMKQQSLASGGTP